MTKQVPEVEAFDPDARFFAKAPMTRREYVSVVKLAQRRIRWLEKQMALEQSLGPQRAQLMVDAGAELVAFEAELRAEGQWDYQGPTARYAEYNLCKEMIVLARKLSGNAHLAELAQALTTARSDLEQQVNEAQRWGTRKWDILKEARGA